MASKSYKAGEVAGEINEDGYFIIEIDGVAYHAEDLAWLYVHGVWPKTPLIHIDGNKSNNRMANLRESEIA